MGGFRLATVERLRRQELQTRAQELHAATGSLEMTVIHRNLLLAKLNDGAGSDATTTGANLQLASAYRARLRAKVRLDAQQIVELQVTLDEARIAWLTARVALRAVESLHERHRVADRRERARLDQRELDDLAGTRREKASKIEVEEVVPQ